MKHHKHKDIAFSLPHEKLFFVYEEAVVAAVAHSVINNGKAYKIDVYANTAAAAAWWDRFFGGGNSVSRWKSDPDKPIDRFTIRATAGKP